MKTVSDLDQMRAMRLALPAPVGFVPTMGYLHDGHLALVRRASAECASVVVSIFVNPSQFGPGEDFADYPRDVPRDLGLLAATDVDLVWAPASEVMYPRDSQTWITVEDEAQPLEGRMRQGHFRGVATVVAKLFNVVVPDRAYFGQKDAQQAVVIQRMVRDLNFPIEIVVCPTVREPDGLAMSSRNIRLTPDERRAATVLHRALSAAKSARDAGDRDAARLRQIMSTTIAGEPLARLQYVSCAHPDTLRELETVSDDALLSMAVVIGRTRLIDNFWLREGRWRTGELKRT